MIKIPCVPISVHAWVMAFAVQVVMLTNEIYASITVYTSLAITLVAVTAYPFGPKRRGAFPCLSPSHHFFKLRLRNWAANQNRPNYQRGNSQPTEYTTPSSELGPKLARFVTVSPQLWPKGIRNAARVG